MTELPPIGTPVYLAPGPDISYRSRLESMDGRTFTVTAPLETSGDRIALQPGQPFEVFWAQPRARILLPCRLVEITDSVPPQWVLAATAGTRQGNRRQYVRGGGGTVVRLAPGPNSPPVEGRLLDISEAGLRCWVVTPPPIEAGERIGARVLLGTGEVDVAGVVHAVRDAVDVPGYHVILRFHSSESVAQKIRQYIFGWEIAERRHVQER